MTKKPYKNLPVIKVSYAEVLSRPLFYPENEIANDFIILMKRKSITKREVEHLRAMGFEVQITPRKIEIPENCR